MIDLSVPWVLLRVRDQLFGVRATNIREMAEIPAVTAVPNVPEYVLGLITMRGQVIPTIDLRRRLGMPTADEDLRGIVTRLEQAQADHASELERLESAGTQGLVPSDATQCSLGVWLKSVKSRNPLIQAHLAKLEGPHAALHAEEAHVAGLLRRGDPTAGEALRGVREQHLGAFVHALAACRERLVHAHRQIVVVLMHEGRLLGSAVDEVESIERLKDRSIEELPLRQQGMTHGLTRRVGRRVKDDEVVLLLEVEELFEGNGEIPTDTSWMSGGAEGEPETPDMVGAPATDAEVAGEPRSDAWCEEPAGAPVGAQAGESQPSRVDGAVAEGPVAAGPPRSGRNEPVPEPMSVEEARASMAWCGAPRAGSACTFGR